MSIYSRFLIVIMTAFLALSGCTTAPKTNRDVATHPQLKNYISYDLAYPYYKMIYDRLQQRIGKTLKSRGEAHITVITPPEYAVLTKKLAPERIHQMAADLFKQSPKFTKICLGHGQQTLASGLQHVYYVVVESKDLLELRRQMAIESGLVKSEFNPDLFFPHITIGFTERDMYYEDGVIKDIKSCPDELKSILLER